LLGKEGKGTDIGHTEYLVEPLGNLPREVNCLLEADMVIVITGLPKCVFFLFLGAFGKFGKGLFASSCLSVRPSVHMETWLPTNRIFYEILYLNILRKHMEEKKI